MAVDQFKDLTWNNDDPIDSQKLNTMTANTRYLFERAPKLYYKGYGVKRTSGIKIAAGTVPVPAKKTGIQAVNVYFGSFFTSGAKPIVVTGIVAPEDRRISVTCNGISGPNYVPDHRGFIATIALTATSDKNNYFHKRLYLQYLAFAY